MRCRTADQKPFLNLQESARFFVSYIIIILFADGSISHVDDDACSRTPMEGRRIVELCFVAKQLDSGCTVCGLPLHLSSCFAEEKYGLASVLEIECEECGCTTKISTSKTHHSSATAGRRRGRPAYDVNTKSALGVMCSGIAVTQAN